MITETKTFLFDENEPIKAASIGGDTRIVSLDLGSLHIELSIQNARALADKLNEEVFRNLASMAGEAACKIFGKADWVKSIGINHNAADSHLGVYVVTDKPIEIGMHREVIDVGMIISKALGQTVRAFVMQNDLDEGMTEIYSRAEAPAECGAA